MNSCKATKADGSPCDATPMSDTGYCFFHDPNKKKERTEARSAGGNRTKTLPKTAEYIRIRNLNDLLALMEKTINFVLTGEIDSRTGGTVGQLASIMVKIKEQQGSGDKPDANKEDEIFDQMSYEDLKLIEEIEAKYASVPKT